MSMQNKKTRRGNGEGSICKIRNDRYRAQLMIGRDSKGKKQIKSVYGKSKKEVINKLAELKASIYSGSYFEPTKILLSQWLEKWFETYKTRTSRIQTTNLYKILIRTIILPFLGDKKMVDIKPIQIQELINHLVDSKYSYSTVEKIKNILNPAFNVAVINKIIKENPFRGIQMPARLEKDIRAFSRNEQLLFVENAKGRAYYEFYITALNSGGRCCELLALTWEDIDLINMNIKINKTLVKDYIDDKEVLIVQKMPKTKKSNRVVPIPEKVNELLTQLKQDRISKGLNDNNIVFCSKVSTYLCPRNLRRSMHLICKRAGIIKASTHVLRHTYATRLFEEKVDIKSVSELLGHSNINITFNEYIHIFQETKRKSADVLNNLNLE
jgi:integrase